LKHSFSEPAQGPAILIAASGYFTKVKNAAQLPRSIGAARREGEYFRPESNKVLQALTKRLLVWG
jgi:hypothetical protein